LSFLAKIAAGTAPLTKRKRPSSASSPIYKAVGSDGNTPCAQSIPSAIGRSRSAPSFGRSAGARFTAILPLRGYPIALSAALTLSLDSLTDISGSPTIDIEKRPPVISTSISTRSALIPCRVTPPILLTPVITSIFPYLGISGSEVCSSFIVNSSSGISFPPLPTILRICSTSKSLAPSLAVRATKSTLQFPS